MFSTLPHFRVSPLLPPSSQGNTEGPLLVSETHTRPKATHPVGSVGWLHPQIDSEQAVTTKKGWKHQIPVSV